MVSHVIGRVVPVVTQVFSLIGIFTCVILARSYIDSARWTPSYAGSIYDCRQANHEALLVLCQLVGKKNYQPAISIYQYPDNQAMMISMEHASEQVNFIFQEVPVTVRIVKGKPPEPTPSMFSLVRN